MRWLFADSPAEKAEHAAIISRIDGWWSEFQRKAKDISGLFSQKQKWDLPQWMSEHLQSINSNLMWEFGPAVEGQGHRLVITPETHRHLRPIVESILRKAPRLDGWEFYSYRLPESYETAEFSVEGRTGGSMADFRVKAVINEHNQIDLNFTSPSTKGPDDQDSFRTAFVAIESLLGEECLDTWIGAIDVTSANKKQGKMKSQPDHVGLDQMKVKVDELISEIRDSMPSNPHHEWVENAEWSMWKLEPSEAVDYYEQQDLFVGKSVNPKQWIAAHQGGLFSSKRYSRCGETFCYLKTDGSQGLGDGIADKAGIEDALDEILKPAKLGCHIGGGTGLRYSYVDLALTDLNKAIPLIRTRMQQGQLPKRSWIQFFDGELQKEWVGIYPDTPAPPLLDDAD